MNDPASPATVYLLSQLRSGGIKPSSTDFDVLWRELPFLSKRSYQEFFEKVLPFDHRLYAPLSVDCSGTSSQPSFDTSQTQVQLSQYLTEPEMDAQIGQTRPPSPPIGESNKSNGETSPPPPIDNYSSALLRIHVVDEAKRRSQDFFCAKWLLVSRMKFFAAHLTDDSKPDDVDISVQCDVVIFDWLMKFVHKDLPDSTGSPSLEPANVISILISSDFLQMDDLVTDCLTFIHTNTESVVSNSPANFNCISEIVLKRLAALYDIEELDALKDKKDRLKSRLYMAKIEAMFTRTTQHLLAADSTNKDHLAQLIVGDIDVPDASSLFQCRVCQRMLTPYTHLLIPCEASQLQLTRWGEVIANHVPIDNFDVNEYVNSLFRELRSWRAVFWRVWGTVQCLRCVRCRQWFRCIDFSSCWTHPEKPTSDFYPCCRQSYRPFDPFSVRTGGCRLMDHLTDFQVGGDRTKRTYELLLRFRDPIVGEQASQNAQSYSQPLALDPVVFLRSLMQVEDTTSTGTVTLQKPPDRLAPASTPRAANSPPSPNNMLFDFTRFQMPTWNVELSTRLNQDNQRQADYRIMREMCEYIVGRKASAGNSLSGTSSNNQASMRQIVGDNLPVVQASTASTSSARDVPGGLYARIEHQLRTKMQALLAPSSRSGPKPLGGTPGNKQRPSSLLKLQ